jgi:hypothetical protein
VEKGIKNVRASSLFSLMYSGFSQCSCKLCERIIFELNANTKKIQIGLSMFGILNDLKKYRYQIPECQAFLKPDENTGRKVLIEVQVDILPA